jgi:hypothetical protein
MKTLVIQDSVKYRCVAPPLVRLAIEYLRRLDELTAEERVMFSTLFNPELMEPFMHIDTNKGNK